MAKTKAQETIYPELSVDLYDYDSGLTCAQAEKLLGWVEEPEDSKFEPGESLLVSGTGRKVVCSNNAKNRPFTPSLARLWQGEILRGNWKLNGETIIIGKNGQILSGQHRLIGLVLAVQLWESNPDAWPEWDGEEPTLPCIVVVGVDEEDSTVNTIDTGKPRTLDQVLYRSVYFSSLTTKDRKTASKVASYAIALLSHRAGLDSEAFAPGRRTHSDSIDVLDRHPKLLEAVAHIVAESDGTRLTDFIPLGYAAAMLYLMGSSSTDPTPYREAESPSESHLNWDNWDDACDFIVNLGQDIPEFQPIRDSLGDLIDKELDTPLNRCHVICLAWITILSGREINRKSVGLRYHHDGEEAYSVIDYPSVGGIDLGDPTDPVVEPDITDPTNTPVEKEEPTKKRSGKTQDTDAKPPVAKKKAVKKSPPKSGGD